MKLCLTLLLFMLLSCASVGTVSKDQIAAGKRVAFDRNQGNCLACHKIEDGDMPGNVGPELSPARIHGQDKAHLRAMIWDASRFNPDTSMPPYGRNKVLSTEDIDNIVDYLWSLQ